MSEQKTITISLELYNEIVHAAAKLDDLKAQGVDNWDGYDQAMEELNKEEEDNND